MVRNLHIQRSQIQFHIVHVEVWVMPPNDATTIRRVHPFPVPPFLLRLDESHFWEVILLQKFVHFVQRLVQLHLSVALLLARCPLLRLDGVEVFDSIQANSPKPAASNQGRFAAGSMERRLRVRAKENRLEFLLSPPIGCEAVRLGRILDFVYVQGLEFVRKLVEHHFAGAHIALTIVAHEHMLVFRIYGHIPLEVRVLFDGQRLAVIRGDKVRPGCKISRQQRRDGVHSHSSVLGLPELLEFGKVALLAHVFVHVRARTQEYQVSHAMFWPFLRTARSQVELAVEGQDARVDDLARISLVNACWIYAAAR
mmetsp:Transcript_16741/g.46877  ORF Transcript_16741/g.46877 Transcript_16741/m.46877 type:complete len:311 (-) Transcript_16741:301-1233(-)